MSQDLIAPLAISVSLGLTVLLALAAVGAMRSPARVARGRVGALVEATSPYSAETPDTIRRNRRRRFGWLTEGLSQSANEGTRRVLDRSGLPLRPGEYVAIRLMAIVGGAIAGSFLGLSGSGTGAAMLGGFVGLAAGFVVPPAVVRMKAQRRAMAVESQLVELCELMASMMRSGYGYVQALTSTAAELEEPLAGEISRLVDAVRLGGNVDEALGELTERLGSRDFEMIATAITIQRRSGGNLSEILEGVAETIRHRQSFERDLRALTARERFSAIIVVAVPFVLTAILTAMDPVRYGLLFTDPRGQIVLAAAIVLDIVGYVIIRRVSKVEV